MKIEIIHSVADNIVIAIPEADVKRENVKKTVLETMRFSKNVQCGYILFDIRKCEVGQSIIDGFTDMVGFGENFGVPDNYIIAVVYNKETYPADRAEFIESVTNTLMNPTYRMFAEYDQAISWLKSRQAKRR